MAGLLDWLNPLNALKDGLLTAQKQALDAKNDTARLAAEQDMAYWKGQIDLAMVAAQNDKWYSIRSLIGYCVLIMVFKLIVWDTVLGLGVTPNPGQLVLWITVTVIGFYFASKTAIDIARTLVINKK
tara:strand:- start:106 stop:486 length:381 start_codon:yes stop_codon:yes gene_type:complete